MQTYEGHMDGRGLRIAVVASRFNDLITRRLLDGAADSLRRLGVAEADQALVWVPGAFELALVARRLALSASYDAVICLGAVVRGATAHFDHVCNQTASGIARAGQETGVPVIFGVLTTDTLEQALDRAGGKAGNKGADAAVAAVEMARLLEALSAAAR